MNNVLETNDAQFDVLKRPVFRIPRQHALDINGAERTEVGSSVLDARLNPGLPCLNRQVENRPERLPIHLPFKLLGISQLLVVKPRHKPISIYRFFG